MEVKGSFSISFSIMSDFIHCGNKCIKVINMANTVIVGSHVGLCLRVSGQTRAAAPAIG